MISPVIKDEKYKWESLALYRGLELMIPWVKHLNTMDVNTKPSTNLPK